MKKLFAFILIFGLSAGISSQNNLFFASKPSLSPDGNIAFFSYEGDIWKVQAGGGTAERMTALAG